MSSGQLVLREVEDRDLGVLFEHSTDRDAIRMAAFTSPETGDRTAFERRWARLRATFYDEQGRRDRRSCCGSHCELRPGGSPRDHVLDRPGGLGPGHCHACSTRVLAAGGSPSASRTRCERQRRVDSCVDEMRFPRRRRGARLRSWAQRGNGRGRPSTRLSSEPESVVEVARDRPSSVRCVRDHGARDVRVRLVH